MKTKHQVSRKNRLTRPHSRQTGAAAALVRRELKKLSSSARDVAAEQERDRVRCLDELRGDITVLAPGLIAGMSFERAQIVRFLAQAIQDADQRIEGAMQSWAKMARKVGTEPHDVSFAFAAWREVALFAHEFFTEGGQLFEASNPILNSPLDGLLSEFQFSVEDLLHLFCEFLHDQRLVLANLVRAESNAGRPRLALAEALVIAETLMAANGSATEYDDDRGSNVSRPTKLQQLMWETLIYSIEERYKSPALAA